jgi:hypothetical protein
MKPPRKNRISGQWSPRPIEMLDSPAYRTLSLSAHRVISRIEIELLGTAVIANGRLPVTKQASSLLACTCRGAGNQGSRRLGFIRVTERGRGGNWAPEAEPFRGCSHTVATPVRAADA